MIVHSITRGTAYKAVTFLLLVCMLGPLFLPRGAQAQALRAQSMGADRGSAMSQALQQAGLPAELAQTGPFGQDLFGPDGEPHGVLLDVGAAQASLEEAQRRPDALANPISLARVQSSYAAGPGISGTLTITFTVRNNRPPVLLPNIPVSATITETISATLDYDPYADPNTIRNVLLADGLSGASGFLSASPMPDRLLPELAWNLGDVPPLGSVTATLVLSVPGSVAGFTDLDLGATAYGTLQGRAVSASTAPAVLAPESYAQWLVWTVDADYYDEYMAQKASELGNDWAEMFAYVRSLGYESYKGSLRGTRGTLWSEAGNSLDQASLLVAMLRGSGVPARYLHGTLDTAQAQELILSMFPEPTSVIGHIPPGTELADPANDPQLLAETVDHWWVEAYLPGTGWTALDPSFAGAAPGQAFAAPDGPALAEVPDDQRHKVTITLKVEQAASLSALIPDGLDVSYPLSHTFNTVDLVGKPIVLRHMVSSEVQGGAIFWNAQHIYTPCFVRDDLSFMKGEPFQELMSNFPFGTKIVTGEWLLFDAHDVDGQSVHYEWEILDRIGLSNRLTGGHQDISDQIDANAAFGDYDAYAIAISVSETDKEAVRQKTTQSRNQSTLAISEMQSSWNVLDTDDLVAMGSFLSRYRPSLYRAQQQLLGSMAHLFYAYSDQMHNQYEGTLLTKGYAASPKVVLVSQSVLTGSVIQTSYDLVHVRERTLVSTGQSATSAGASQMLAGMGDTSLENTLLANLVQGEPLSALSVIQKAHDTGVVMELLSSDTLETLQQLPLSDQAKARITLAVQEGKAVHVPSEMVSINETSTVAWWEIDPTGYTIGVMENGRHCSQFADPLSVKVAQFSQVGTRINTTQAPQKVSSLGNGHIQNLTEFGSNFWSWWYGSKGFRTGCGAVYAIFAYIAAYLDLLNPLDPDLADYLDEIIGDPIATAWIAWGVAWGMLQASGLMGDPDFAYGATAAMFVIALALIASMGGSGGGGGGPPPPPPPSPPSRSAHGQETNASLANTVAPLPDLQLAPTNWQWNYTTQAAAIYEGSPNLTGGPLTVDLRTSQIQVAGETISRWPSAAQTGIQYNRFTALSATVRLPGGEIVGQGQVIGSVDVPASFLLSGSGLNYQAQGWAWSASYAPALQGIALAPTWAGYMVTATATVFAPALAHVDVLTINGDLLEGGDYILEVTGPIQLWGNGNGLSSSFTNLWQANLGTAGLHLSPGQGSALLGSYALDTKVGIAAAGFTGPITITEQTTTTNRVQLAGSVEQVLELALSPTTTQVLPFQSAFSQVDVRSNLTDTYYLQVLGPGGWDVDIDNRGAITLAPGRNVAQPGDYTFLVLAQSYSRTTLINSRELVVQIVPHQGMSLDVVPDNAFTVPMGRPLENDAVAGDTNTGQTQVPGAAYTINVTNTSTTAHTFTVAVDPAFPVDWLVLSGAEGATGTELALPAGGIGQVGLYVSPTLAGLLPPGIRYPFTVTAAASDAPALEETVVTTFTMPAVPFNYLEAEPALLYASPGSPASFDLHLSNVGNAPGTFAVTATLPITTWTWSGPYSTTLDAGAADVHAVTFTPSGSALGQVEILHLHGPAPGSAYTQTEYVAVQIAGPCVVQTYQAARAAAQLDGQLAAALDNLAFQIGRWEQDEADTALRDRTVAALDTVIAHLQAGYPLVDTADLEALAAAPGVAGFCGPMADLEDVLTRIAQRYGALTLRPGFAAALVGRPVSYTLSLENRGSLTTTYALTLSGLPAGWADWTHQSVNLAPGDAAGLTVVVTPTAVDLRTLRVRAAAVEDAFIQAQATAGLNAVDRFVQVVSLQAEPAFLAPGPNSAALTAGVANVAGVYQAGRAGIAVLDALGSTVYSDSLPFSLHSALGLQVLDLGGISTTGWLTGSYTITLDLVDSGGRPIPDGSGRGTLAIGQALRAHHWVNPALLPPGAATVTTYISTTLDPSAYHHLQFGGEPLPSPLSESNSTRPQNDIQATATMIHTLVDDSTGLPIANASGTVRVYRADSSVYIASESFTTDPNGVYTVSVDLELPVSQTVRLRHYNLKDDGCADQYYDRHRSLDEADPVVLYDSVENTRTIRLAPATTLVIALNDDSSGLPIPNAAGSVRLYETGTTVGIESEPFTTDGNGVYTVSFDTLISQTVRLRHSELVDDGYAVQYYDRQRLLDEAALLPLQSGLNSLSMRLAPVTVLVNTLVDDDTGLPIPNVSGSVRIYPASSTIAIVTKAFTTDNKGVYTVTFDPLISETVRLGYVDLADDGYSDQYYDRKHTLNEATLFSMQSGNNNLTTLLLPATTLINTLIDDATGQPIANSSGRVRVYPTDSTLAIEAQDFNTDAAGVFTVTFDAWISQNVHLRYVDVPGHLDQYYDRQLSKNEATPVSLHGGANPLVSLLLPGSRLINTLRDDLTGLPISNTAGVVTAYAADGSTVDSRGFGTDANGVYSTSFGLLISETVYLGYAVAGYPAQYHDHQFVLAKADPVPLRSDQINLLETRLSTYGTDLTPPTLQEYAVPGAFFVYRLTLKNYGSLTDTFSLALSGAAWPVTPPPLAAGPLPAGAEVTVGVTVTVPATATIGTHDVVVLTAASVGNPNLTATTTMTTTAATALLQMCVAMDGSGSIDPPDFDLIKTGLANSIRDAGTLPRNGSVEISVVQYGSNEARTEVEPVVILSAADAEEAAALVESMEQIGGGTPANLGIDLCTSIITSSGQFAIAQRQIINLPTDGEPNLPHDDDYAARDNAVLAGVDAINAEAVGASPETINFLIGFVHPQPGYLAPPFIPDQGGFVISVTTFAQFEEAMRQKLAFVLENPVYLVDVDHSAPVSGVAMLTTTITPPPLYLAEGPVQTQVGWRQVLTPTHPSELAGFQSQLAPLRAGEARRVANSTAVSYAGTSGDGRIQLGPLYVAATHLVAVTPATRTVVVGQAASYDVILFNPTDALQAYSLTLAGLPLALTPTLPPTVTLQPGQVLTLPLSIDVGQSNAPETLPTLLAFSAMAETTNGGGDAAQAVLGIRPAAFALEVNPGLLSADAGETVTYTVVLTNTEASTHTYTLNAVGLEGNDLDLSPSVVIAAGQARDIPLRVTARAPRGLYPFTLAATMDDPIATLQAPAALSILSELGVSGSLSPTLVLAGQASPGRFTLSVTNSGSLADTYTLTVDLPGGWSAGFRANEPHDVPPSQPYSLALTPYVFNAADLHLLVTPADGTPVGTYPITVNVVSDLDPAVSARVPGQVQVSPYGVTVQISPQTTTMHPLGSQVWDVTVTNTGEQADSFNLVAGGVVSSTALFNPDPVSLDAGQSTVVQLSAGPLAFALPTTYPFAVTAHSLGETQVQGYDTAEVTFLGYEAVDAHLLPLSQTLTDTLSAHYLLLVTNTGNVDTVYTFTTSSDPGGLGLHLEIGELYIPARMAAGMPLTARGRQAGTYELQVRADSTSSGATDLTTATLVISESAVPCYAVSGVAIAGPTHLLPGATGQYTATYAPPYATQPLTLSWDNGTIGASAAYSWTDPGSYTVTVTATNACGQAVDSFVVTVGERPCEPVTAVEISGPAGLLVGQAGLFTATYAPPTATLPLTLTWDNGTVGATAAYSWTTPGSYTVTVTATNACGQAVDAFPVQVTLECQPVQGVDIAGPTELLVGQAGLYTAGYSPPTATAPVALTWDNGSTGATAAYSWTTPGVYTVTVTASNACGQARDALAVTVSEPPCLPVEEVSIEGPAGLLVGQAGLFTATYAPPTATLPLTLTWDNGTVGSSAAYSWTQPGSYTVTVTATNACGQALDAFPVQVTLECRPVQGVTVTGPTDLLVGQAGLYTAGYSPPTATAPVALTWDNGSTGATAAYSWTTPGVYTVTVTATNACGQARDALAVTVSEPPCLPVEEVSIEGPAGLLVGQTGLYTASTTPPTATLPLALAWDNGTIGASTAYSWTLPGTYTVTVTATNPCGQVHDTLVVEISSPQHRLYLPLVFQRWQR